MKLGALNPDLGSDAVTMEYICFPIWDLYVKISFGAKPSFDEVNG